MDETMNEQKKKGLRFKDLTSDFSQRMKNYEA